MTPRTNRKATVRHPIFARGYARIAAAAEEKGGGEHRKEMLSGASGSLIEVGAGTGLNFRHYPSTVRHVLAVEPEPLLRSIARKEAARASISIDVVDGVADALPAEDGSMDGAMASLVLCSVPDQDSALAELFHVLRAGGELRFYEHVRANSSGFARAQRLADVIHPLLGGGCHTSRDTLGAIERAGFVIQAHRRFRFVPCVIDQDDRSSRHWSSNQAHLSRCGSKEPIGLSATGSAKCDLIWANAVIPTTQWR